MALTTVVLLVAGLALLVVGGELLVRGASRAAAALGISPLVIGLTVVAFGTSSPEMAVSIQAGLAGNPDIAVGNVVGSNIFNVLFILGACALILPLVVAVPLVRREVPIMIGVSLLLLLLALDGRIGPLDGALLFAGIVIYTVWSIVASRRETAAGTQAGGGAPPESPPGERGPVWLGGAVAALALAIGGFLLGWLNPVVAGFVGLGALVFLGSSLLGGGRGALASQVGLILAGLGTLVLGAGLLIDSSTAIARALGVSDLIIGLTIVAAGTSLPEVATSVIATLRKERDIAIGNVVGSNIFNILGILGLSALITPGGLTVAPAMVNFDIPVMIAVALACLPIFFTGFAIARWEGGLFLGYYAAYTAYLVLAAQQHDALPLFSGAMGLFVIPLTIITLLVLGANAYYQSRLARLAGPPRRPS